MSGLKLCLACPKLCSRGIFHCIYCASSVLGVGGSISVCKWTKGLKNCASASTFQWVNFSVCLWLAGIKRRVLMHNPRLFLSRGGFFSKSGLLPWYTTNPPDLSQSFWGRAHKGDFTSVTVRKHPSRQKYQKKQRHLSSLEDSWQER